jgi:hypothetical protein
VGVVCCLVKVSVSGRSLVQKSPTECGVSQCDRKASIMSSWEWVVNAMLRLIYLHFIGDWVGTRADLGEWGITSARIRTQDPPVCRVAVPTTLSRPKKFPE